MNRDEIIRNLKYTMEKHRNDYVPTFGTNIFVMCQDILNYLEGEPCADAVSRQEALNLFNNSDEYGWEMSLLKKKIKDLPPVKPIACIAEINFSKEDMQEMVNEKIKEIVEERKKGKWIKKENLHGKVKQAREEISKQFVDLQDGSEEWRSYVNETVLECVEILDKLIAESEK